MPRIYPRPDQQTQQIAAPAIVHGGLKVDATIDLLTARQREANELLRGPQRHTALVGGARAGKTALFVRATVMRALRAASSRHAIMRLNGNAIWPSIAMDTFPFVMSTFFSGVRYETFQRMGYFKFPNESELWLGGIADKDAADKILGREYVTIFFNEVSQIPFSSVMIGLTRLAQVVRDYNDNILTQRAYYDLNPVGKGHWSNVEFGEMKDPVSKHPLPDPHNYQRMFLNPEDNKENLSEEFLLSLQNMPARHRARFYEGKYVDETENALWTAELIEAGRVDSDLVKLPDMSRVVVAIDPSGARSRLDNTRDMIGIVVCGLGADGHGYLLEDRTMLGHPKEWARTAIALYHKWKADRIVAETNYGGALVENTIHTEDAAVPYKEVTASRGKVVRASPVAALYGDPQQADPQKALSQIRIHHVGRFAALEDEMLDFTDLGYTGERSPNRVDAMVWGFTELMLGPSVAGWLEFWKADAERNQAGVVAPPPQMAPPKLDRVVMYAPAPHQNYAPHKERRYMSNPDCLLLELTASGMVRGIHPDDALVLERQGCRRE